MEYLIDREISRRIDRVLDDCYGIKVEEKSGQELLSHHDIVAGIELGVVTLFSKKSVIANTHPSYGPVHIDDKDLFVHYRLDVYYDADLDKHVSGELSKLKHHQEDLEYSAFHNCFLLAYENAVIQTYSTSMEHVLYENEMKQGRVIDHHGNSHRFRYINHGDAEGEWVKSTELIYCSDISDYVTEEEALYCDYDDEYYFEEGCMPRQADRGDRSIINEYHNGPASLDKTSGSRFAIGFEVEKTSLNGETEVGAEVGEFDFFARFETDSSCGTEGITHVLPLSGSTTTRAKKVFKMMDEAESIINGDYNHKCGGHITISCGINPTSSAFENPMKPIDLLEKMRGNLSILYALYRFRLNNSYCNGNKDLKGSHNSGYQVIQLKSSINAVEIRLFNKVRSVEQLKLRYKLMYILMKKSFDGSEFSDVLKEVKPIIKLMYGGDLDKVREILQLSVYFRTYLIADVIHTDIDNYINGEDNEQ